MKEEGMVSRYFDEEGKLKQYPAKKSLRKMVLAQVAKQFETGAEYNEKEVNERIHAAIAFSDHELIRREMFMYGFLNRLRDGSKYWLADPQPVLE